MPDNCVNCGKEAYLYITVDDEKISGVCVCTTCEEEVARDLKFAVEWNDFREFAWKYYGK